MFTKTKLNKIAVAVALSVGLSTASMAQVTSSGMTGQVVGPQGSPAPGTVVTITHVPTGSVKTAVVNSSGSFNVTGLRVGGPYTVVFDSDTYEDTTITDIFIDLGETLPLDLALESSSNLEVISVTGSQVSMTAFGANSPSRSFSLNDLQTVPAINRNINDILRVDPRLYVDEGGNDGIQCAGRSPRFNSLTVDGVRQNDLFGLNNNGYPTERQPFPFDALESVTVEFAPFDVYYGGFTACNINAVTKTGTNELSGNVFIDYTSDSLTGDSLEGEGVDVGSFDETRFGFTVGAPLIKDKLFIFAAYEKLEGVNLFERGASDSSALTLVDVTTAELNEIAQISRDVYLYDPGPTPSALDNEDEKFLIKLDWNINENHRASLAYNYNDGNNFTESDGDSDEFEFLNHLYERGAELKSTVASVYSDWTEKFSTEIRFNYLEVDNRQNSLAGDGTVGGNDFGEIRVELPSGVDVYLGADDSRHSNDLDYDATSLILRGFYYADNGHELTFGYEQNKLNVFNLFVQQSETEIRFDGIENFRIGLADRVEYNFAISGDINDAAADWGYTEHNAYFQDSFYLNDDLQITAGIRYDWYTSNDVPNENPEFVEDYGFSNATNFDGEGLFQPRLGFLYTVDEKTELRGGVGLYSGGNPNVWLSNNFSNTNTTQVGSRVNDFDLFGDDVVYVNGEDGVPNGPGYAVPAVLDAAVDSGEGSNFEINYLDPDFELPSEWKLALGMTHVSDGDYVFNFDAIYSIAQNPAIVLRGDLVEVGIREDGYIDYDSPNVDTFELTNSDLDARAISLSTSMSKSWENGIDLTVGYNFNDAEDVQPMTSAVAFSNYNNRAFTNPNEQVIDTSDWNIKHRVTVDFRYTREFFAGYQTRFSAFGLFQSGRPYSITEDVGVGFYGFTPFIGRGEVLALDARRNDQESPNWSKIDVAVFQDIPAFNADHSAQVFLILDNFTNLLNDDWGILEEVSFNTVQADTLDPTPRSGTASLWSMRFGVRYAF